MANSDAVTRLDQHLRLRLKDLDGAAFERFFLGFFNAGISLPIKRNGELIERRVIEANTYAAGSGRADKGIDLVTKMEGGETWAFQCKRHKEWSVSETKKAIAKVTYPAQHYFLLVACDPSQGVEDEIDRHPNWCFWNLDRICAEFRLRVPQSRQPQVLPFLSPEELKRFAPYTTDALVPARDYFERIQQAAHSFHHHYPLVGRAKEMKQLEAFASDTKVKVLMISAKGGDGKTRLLWEFARRLEGTEGAPDVLFLNPHSTGDLTLALWDKDTPRIIVVDDAHRLERVSHELLGRVTEAPSTKLILATRPQGNEALEARLREHGFSDPAPSAMPPLGKKNMATLAAEALGSAHRARARELVALTGDSPFLTTMAGDLLRRGKLQWGQWHADSDFRATVFRSFESDNLTGLAESDQKHGTRLLRVIAMVAPVTPDAVFHRRAAACLGTSTVEVEALLRRLQAAGVVSAEKNNLRVIPDLFADFLVFDTAFDSQHRLPALARAVLEQFAGQAAAILRNLAEATWVTGTEGIGRDELLEPLLQGEFARFEASNFYERGQMLERWAEFSVFVPQESLALAGQALALTTAPRGATPEFQLDEDDNGINSHHYVKGQIPALLKPVALWHDAYRAKALDFLWQLGLNTPLEILGGAQNHPWNIIAEVMKFTPRKPIGIIAAVLSWMEELVQRPSVLSEIEKRRAILTTFLSPCFERLVEYSEREGMTLRFGRVPVDIGRTTPLRDHALKILSWVVDHGSWLAALGAVDTIKYALHRVAKVETAGLKHAEKFRESWRAERLKALAVLNHARECHSQPLVTFAVRQVLLRDIVYEEDAEFAKAARAILAKITETTELRVFAVINSQGYFEFAETLGAPRTEEAREEMKRRWQEYVEALADELLRRSDHAVKVITYLEDLAEKCTSAGFTPNFGELFGAMARRQPARALDLIQELIRPGSKFRLSAAWPQFLYGFADQTQSLPLLQAAAGHPQSAVRRGVVDFLQFRDRKDMRLSDAEKTLLAQIASRARADEIMSFVRLVQSSDDHCADWAFRLLGALPLDKLGTEANGEILAALNPYHARNVALPPDTVRHVLDALVPVPEIKVDHYGGGWERLLKDHPRAVYDFVLQRVAHYEQLGEHTRYQVLPHDILARFRLDGLATEADFPAICAFLWDKLRSSNDTFMGLVWRELFQGIVMAHEQYWLPWLTAKIEAAATIDQLCNALAILHFDGSLVVFGYPALTKTALVKARDIEGTNGYERLRSELYVISGPQGRSFTNGELNKDSDYVEAAAIKAAKAHAQDPVLGPFYRWIVEVEQHDREQHKRRYLSDMAALDDS